MEPGSTASIDRRPLLAASIALTAGGLLAAYLPISTREAYVFARFVRFPMRDLLGSFDPAATVLNIFLMKRAVGLLRLSTFSLRLPELAGLALCLLAAAKLSRGRWMAVAITGAAGLALQLWRPGAGLGLGLGLWLCGVQQAWAYLKRNQADGLPNLNLAGLCLGLAIAANFCYLAPSAALAAWVGWSGHRHTALPILTWAERLLATAVVTAFLLLVLPFSHATAGALLRVTIPPRAGTGQPPGDLRALTLALEREARGRAVRIAAPADVVPVLEYYRDHDRDGDWRIFPFPHPADYSVIDSTTAPASGQVLYRGRTLALAR